MKKLMYLDVADKIMMQLLNDKIAPGSKIESVRTMALSYNVNPKTIQKAFDYLDDLGIFTTQKGEGRFLSDDADVINNIKIQLLNNMILDFTNKMVDFNCEQDYLIEKIKEYYNAKN